MTEEKFKEFNDAIDDMYEEMETHRNFIINECATYIDSGTDTEPQMINILENAVNEYTEALEYIHNSVLKIQEMLTELKR